jgi:hypothetical protein
VLKKVGRKQQTPVSHYSSFLFLKRAHFLLFPPISQELLNLVDLMCEFVEAMNPGLHLSRKPEVLKDRDLSGELKDVWNAVQSMREKQKYEGHNVTSENLVVYTEFGPPPDQSAPNYEQSIMHLKQQQQQQQQNINNPPIDLADKDDQSAINNKNNSNIIDLKLNESENDKKEIIDDLCKETANLKLPASPAHGDVVKCAADEADSNKLIENSVLPTEVTPTQSDKTIETIKDNRDIATAIPAVTKVITVVTHKTPTHTPPPPPSPVTTTVISQPTNTSSNNSTANHNLSSNQTNKKEKDSIVTSHPFHFNMFRSSKNHHHNNDDENNSKKKELLHNNSSNSDKTDKEKDNKDHEEPKNNIKKGLSFFRRNKSTTPAATTTTTISTTTTTVTPPVTAKTGDGQHEKTIEQFDENSTTPNNKKIELEAATVYAK